LQQARRVQASAQKIAFVGNGPHAADQPSDMVHFGGLAKSILTRSASFGVALFLSDELRFSLEKRRCSDPPLLKTVADFGLRSSEIPCFQGNSAPRNSATSKLAHRAILNDQMPRVPRS
jgi:hypothetical protein